MRPSPALFAIATAVVVVLLVGSGGYGYHRDELYFVAAGDHLAWGYPDQGPLTPALAALAGALAPDSLVALRVAPALAIGAIVLIAGLIARELAPGGRPRAELIAGACVAVGSVFLITGHVLSTATFDLLAWALISLLVIRAVRGGDDRLWLVAGLVLGLGLLNKPLPAFLAVGLLLGVAIAGPRRLLRNRWVWGGAALALAIWSPWLIWQAREGWPQLDVAASISAGGSTSSEPRSLFLPFQFLLVGPLLAPVWIAGLWRLFGDPGLRELRFLGCAWVALAIAFLAEGGKPYYLAGLFPLLLGAGAGSVDLWLDRGRASLRRSGLVAALALTAAVSAVIGLPVLPADELDPVLAVNEDIGETIGWPEFAATVAGVYQRADPDDDPAGTAILAGNYGEAGAIDRYGPALGLPPAFSGHNAYWEWGPPPEEAERVVAVGFGGSELERSLGGCRVEATISNDDDVDNQERGEPVWLCDATRRPWSELWPSFRELG